MDGKINLYGGFLGDERCISLASWTESQVLKTLSDASRYALQNSCTKAKAMSVALNAFRSWGIVQETELSKVLVKEKPNIDKFIRYGVVKFASTLVEGDDTDTFNVRTMVPSSGQYLRDIHIEITPRPEIHSPEFLTNPIIRKVCIHDAMRSVMDKYTECVPVAEDNRAPFVDHDDIQPGDSVSQIGESRQQRSVAKSAIGAPSFSGRRADSTVGAQEQPQTEKAEDPGEPEPDSNSLFQQNVQDKLREMQNGDPAPPKFDAVSAASCKTDGD